MPRFPGLPDWRDRGAYEFLLLAERPVFAWEWLRRLPGYRAAALRNGAGQAQLPLGAFTEQTQAYRWGLHLFEDPALAADKARPIWRSDLHPFVLEARSEPADRDDDCFILDRLCRFATLAIASGVERLLLSDERRAIRVDVRGASLLSGPVRLSYELQGFAAAKRVIPVLHRFIALASSNGFSNSLHRPDRRASRQILLLRTYDALVDGSDQRTIAAELFGASTRRWRIEAPSLRSRVQRLVRSAQYMSRAGLWNLLK